MLYKGDFPLGQTIYIYFNTHKADGTSVDAAGTPAASVYKDNNTTELAGVCTLTIPFDSRTGLACCAVATTDAFFVAGCDYKVVLTAGTVDSISVVGSVIGTFSICNRTPSIRKSTAAAGAAGSITLDASASSVNDFYKGAMVFIVGGTGIGQSRLITGYTGSTQVALVAPNWATTPSTDSIFVILPGDQSDLGMISGVAVSTTAAQLGVNAVNINNVTAASYGSTEKTNLNHIQADITSTPAGVGAAMTITDSTTLNNIADAVLKRDWSSVTGEAARSLLNAARILRNKWTVSSGTLTVYKENDATTAWTATETGTAGADPITGQTP
jgi:hypothetical protein